jgi:hypothetical protein
MVPADDWTSRLSRALGLKEYEQDWGICNSDADRVLEFVAFYDRHQPLHPWDREALAGLVLASFNDALTLNRVGPVERDALRRFLLSHRDEFPHQCGYWSGLAADEFPVSQLIRDIVAS